MHRPVRSVSTRDMILEALANGFMEKGELLAKVAEVKGQKKSVEALGFLIQNKYVEELQYEADDPEAGTQTIIMKLEKDVEGRNDGPMQSQGLEDTPSTETNHKRPSTPPSAASLTDIVDTQNVTATEPESSKKLSASHAITTGMAKGPVRRKRLPFHSPRAATGTKQNANECETPTKRPTLEVSSPAINESLKPSMSRNTSPFTPAKTSNPNTPVQVRKHSIPELIYLTEKWKDVCKQVLQQLKDHASDPNTDYPKLLAFFNIDSHILRYNAEEDCLE